MLKFDYGRFEKDLRESAENAAMPLEEYIVDFDKALGRRAPTEKCVNAGRLYRREPQKDPDLLKHAKGCNYCRRFTKVLFLACCCSSREKLAVIRATYPDDASRPAYKTILSVFKNNHPEDCYELGGFLHWNHLPDSIKDHRRTCRRCSVIMEFFQKMELPDLT